MTKYTNNEQYELDKAALIRIAKGTSIVNFIDNADVIAELLKQSKWIGNYPTEKDIEEIKLNAYSDGYEAGYEEGRYNAYRGGLRNKPCTILKDVEVTTIPS